MRCAHSPDLAVLKEEKELSLGLRVQVADLVDKQDPAVRLFDQADAVGGRARERALDVSKELALDQRFWEGGEVNGDEVAATAEGQQDLLHKKALSGSRGSGQQDGSGTSGQKFHLFTDGLHGGAAAPEERAFADGAAAAAGHGVKAGGEGFDAGFVVYEVQTIQTFQEALRACG